MSVEDKLHEMGLSLSEPNAPVANFVPTVRTGNLLFVAGHIGFMPDGSILHPGKVGRDVTEEQATNRPARRCSTAWPPSRPRPAAWTA